MTEEDKVSPPNLSKTIAAGAMVNALGTIGKGLTPLFFILMTRMYGPSIMGTYLQIFVMINMAVTLTSSGINDGILMFSSRHHDDVEKNGDSQLYKILSNGFVISLFISAVVIVLANTGGSALLFENYRQPDILRSVRYLAWSLPFVIIPVIVVSATKALIIMKWDAIILGFFKPFFLLFFSLCFYFIDPTLDGLLNSYLLTHILLTAISIFVFGKYFSFPKLFKEILHFKPSKPLIFFAIPQNLNMTFNTFITNLDIVMLGYFGFRPEVIGFYGMGAQIVRNIRQIKLTFSGAYAPVIARLYKRGDQEGMNHSFSSVSRWTATIALPVILVVILFKEELIRIFHSSFTADTTFMLLLVVPPLLSCTFGLAGNIVVMTGHSLWNLINSLTVTFINVSLNYVLIPQFGIMGAAVATAAASAIISAMQMVEAHLLVGTHILIRKIYKPFLAIIPGAVGAGILIMLFEGASIPAKTTFVIASLACYALILYFLKLEDEDKKIFMPWKHKSS